MKGLYPEIEPYNSGTLGVSDIHTLYFEESGNPQGKPVIFLHGGPGSATKPKHRQYYNPEKYRIILFDQRGCGKSTPVGELRENTSQDLVKDMEKLRVHLKIGKWMVYGRSWGSTLALLYAETHPKMVTELVIGGVWALTKKELDWLYYGPKTFFTDLWETMTANVPQEHLDDLQGFFSQKIISKDRKDQIEVLNTFAKWDRRLLTMKEVESDPGDEDAGIKAFQVFFHYAKNNGFLEENQLLKNISNLKDIPIYIVQARYDMVTPFETAWKIHKALPTSELIVPVVAGHKASDGDNLEAIIKLTDRLADSQ